MFGLPLAFAAPAVLAALAGLVALYFLLRVTPPSPRQALFPPLRLLIGLNPTETTPARTPWPILALRLAIGALIILAMAEPLWNRLSALSGSGPLLVLIDDGFPAAPTWDKRIDFARERLNAAARSGRIVAIDAMSQGGQDIAPLDRPGVEGAPALARAGPVRAQPRGGVAGDRALSRSRAEHRHLVDRRRSRARRSTRLFGQARVHRSVGRGRDRWEGRAGAGRRRQ